MYKALPFPMVVRLIHREKPHSSPSRYSTVPAAVPAYEQQGFSETLGKVFAELHRVGMIQSDQVAIQASDVTGNPKGLYFFVAADVVGHFDRSFVNTHRASVRNSRGPRQGVHSEASLYGVSNSSTLEGAASRRLPKQVLSALIRAKRANLIDKAQVTAVSLLGGADD